MWRLGTSTKHRYKPLPNTVHPEHRPFLLRVIVENISIERAGLYLTCTNRINIDPYEDVTCHTCELVMRADAGYETPERRGQPAISERRGVSAESACFCRAAEHQPSECDLYSRSGQMVVQELCATSWYDSLRRRRMSAHGRLQGRPTRTCVDVTF